MSGRGGLAAAKGIGAAKGLAAAGTASARAGVATQRQSGASGSGTHRLKGSGVPRAQVAEIQRSRLLTAAVGVVDELGYTRTTVAHITRRARVSRRTFYELFANREECLAALLEDVVGQIEAELAAMSPAGLPWREQMRMGLWTILSFFDREPVLARVCFVQALHGGSAVLERRESILVRLAGAVDEGRLERARGGGCTPLTAEGLVGAAFMILNARLMRRESGPLTSLLGELTGLIVLPYLGAAAARREQARPVPPARDTGRDGSRESSDVGHSVGAQQHVDDPLAGLAMRLTYRTACVLEGVAEYAGASNRQVAEYAGIHDQGQVSKLLARLERLGLLVNRGAGHVKGEPNAWTLTARGEQITRSIRTHTGVSDRRAA